MTEGDAALVAGRRFIATKASLVLFLEVWALPAQCGPGGLLIQREYSSHQSTGWLALELAFWSESLLGQRLGPPPTNGHFVGLVGVVR